MKTPKPDKDVEILLAFRHREITLRQARKEIDAYYKSKLPSEKDLWKIIKKTFKKSNEYMADGTVYKMIDFKLLAKAIDDFHKEG